MALPVPLSAFGVFVPRAFGSGKAVDDHIRPAILVKIVGVGQETLRVGVVDPESPLEPGHNFFRAVRFLAVKSRRGSPDLVAFAKIGSFIPKRAGNNVRFAVFVKITDIRALGPELVRGLHFFKTVQQVFGATQRGGKTQDDRQQKDS